MSECPDRYFRNSQRPRVVSSVVGSFQGGLSGFFESRWFLKGSVEGERSGNWGPGTVSESRMAGGNLPAWAQLSHVELREGPSPPSAANAIPGVTGWLLGPLGEMIK